MPIPTAALRERVSVEAYEASGAYGPSYATAQTAIPARFVGRRRMVRTTTGQDVVSSGSFVFRPGITCPPQSRITRGSDTYTVLDVAESNDLHRGWCVEVLVEGPR